ncbi:MAG: TonB-dependent receptor, partial [Gammaproteobacteria bacterium]
MEASLMGRWGPVDWITGYSFIEATYESAEILASVVDPNGIAVEEGDRIPGIPRHNVKFAFDWAVTDFLLLGSTVIYASEQFLRGDNGNNLDPDDTMW